MRYKDINIRNLLSHTFVWRLLLCAVLFIAPCSTMFNTAHAQPKIYGNVYGGGNDGDTGGNTTVTVCAVDLDGSVFGGAREANVGGRAFVHINGEKMSDDILINYVFGGNDIAGTIGASIDKQSSTIPDELTEAVANGITDDETGDGGGKNKKNKNGYSAFVLTTKENPDKDYKIYIGQLFGGGNGDYTYTKDGNDFIVNRVSDNEEVARSSHDFVKPDIAKTYIEMRGGSCAILYGGGNAVTVTEATDICIDNTSSVTTNINDRDADGNEITGDEYNKLSEETERGRNRLKRMGIYKIDGQTYVSSSDYQFSRVFGGNNKATMAIRPTWHLKQGLIRNLYNGGNKGAMTYPNGIYLYIKDDANPNPGEGFMGLTVGNVYGGCRMADVNPDKHTITQETIEGLVLPAGYAARVTIAGGNIGNVYGGNDISGTVYGGCAVGIHSDINGDVYGGGNGSYPYTDNTNLKHVDGVEDSEAVSLYGDFFYDVNKILERPENASFTGLESVRALDKFRPHTENVSIRLISDNPNYPGKPTIIGGSVYCGGNSATLRPLSDSDIEAKAQLKIGSYVFADKVFLGSNGENMVDEDLLKMLKGNVTVEGLTYDYSQIDLTVQEQMNEYMKGCEISIHPQLVFDSSGDSSDEGYEGYEPYSTYIGSFYCGGNVGSVNVQGMNTLNFYQELVIFNKLVGGCNSANVPEKYDGETKLNAAYNGGLIAKPDNDGNKLTINLSNVKLQPMRWNDVYEAVADGTTLTSGNTYYTSDAGAGKFKSNGTEVADGTNYYVFKSAGTELIWNTVNENGEPIQPVASITGEPTDADYDKRLSGGNVYGGCYSSGHINGNVIINLLSSTVDKETVFADDNTEEGNSGVFLDIQGDDPLGTALNVFGGGYGVDAEIWGSTTINVKDGYTFQVFGGGEEGKVVGLKNEEGVSIGLGNCTVNLDGGEVEYLYGGGFEGDITGSTLVNLGAGRAYDVYGGACNANIDGHTEVFIGRNGGGGDASPEIRHGVFGGNDLGGSINDTAEHAGHGSEKKTTTTYVEYLQGKVGTENDEGDAGIFGGNYGNYDYEDPKYKEHKPQRITRPYAESSFVNFRPKSNANNMVVTVFGGSLGYQGEVQNNVMQLNSYVLVEAPEKDKYYESTDFYGGGAYAGLGTTGGTKGVLGGGSSVIDLYSGRIHNAYGSCNREGMIGYALVNVPTGSTIHANAIFGGGKGYDTSLFDLKPEYHDVYCDTYITAIDYQSTTATIEEALYGGNHNCRVACDTYLNISQPVKNEDGELVKVYGAGYGAETVSSRTSVYMNSGAKVNEVYGGGRDGNVFNFQSLSRWLANELSESEKEEYATTEGLTAGVTAYGSIIGAYSLYLASHPITLPSPMTFENNIMAQKDGNFDCEAYYQTNVYIKEGASVKPTSNNEGGYAYGGGLGANAVVGGRTRIQLLGGTVEKDIYGGGWGGPVMDEHKLKTFTASTNVDIEGGTLRNVYGGGYQGPVGYHDTNTTETTTDILGATYVTVGTSNGSSLSNGIPAISRSAFGGGEQGPIYGTTNLTVNNGYIGYLHNGTTYVENLNDQVADDNKLAPNGNAFGGGYGERASSDITNVRVYGGFIRNSIFGGGEIATVGRGRVSVSDGVHTLSAIDKPGASHVYLYDGKVFHNVFGGGRGYNTWGDKGKLNTDGFVFGTTEVNIHGGEVGTTEGVADGYGNVFGGGDIGYIYSGSGKKSGTRYEGGDEGYYYLYENGAFTLKDGQKQLTEDCKVVIEPCCRVKSGETVTLTNILYPKDSSIPECDIKYLKEQIPDRTDIDANGKVIEENGITIASRTYNEGDYISTYALNTLQNKNGSADAWSKLDDKGIISYNAVFAGGNVSPGSDQVYANTNTVFGNVTASIHDVYHRDLITIGTGRTGGLYGEGNLTLVDGYRELNITNYGTDYYNLKGDIDYGKYLSLSDREKAYYEIKYKCVQACTDNNGHTYSEDAILSTSDLLDLFEKKSGSTATDIFNSDGSINPAYWVQNGVCSRYAGRVMNTIQRADFCGVFGSRMVILGAPDRVPETVDYTNYTINRVREVSLNKKASTAGDAVGTEGYEHGNYFGIYNIVNFLGALTSDVDFLETKRTTNNSDGTTYKSDITIGDQTYHYNDADYTFYNWKKANYKERKRNNGNSHNKLALASGVYLELTTEKGTGTTVAEKDWGYITGVVELDLINVQTGVGGGYVYAKNVHGTRSETNSTNNTLTSLNAGAVARKAFAYSDDNNNVDASDMQDFETSGNFVHDTQVIIDDCYDVSKSYKGSGRSPAHYWYIKGQVYVYDQYISAYTGSPTAYQQAADIPLAITSASHGKIKLVDVQPNYYAYTSDGTNKIPASGIEINGVTYHLNDPISYWDYSLLSTTQKSFFVDKTYVNAVACTVNKKKYAAGEYVMSQTDFNTFKTSDPVILDGDGNVFDLCESSALEFVFRESNNLSHEKGYILTYDMNNPEVWKNKYGGPSYSASEAGIYGQRKYAKNDIITQKVYGDYQTMATNYSSAIPSSGQAVFEIAYIVTANEVNATKQGTPQKLYKGAAVASSLYTSAEWTSLSSSVAEAYICTSTIQLSETEYIYAGDLMTLAQKGTLKTAHPSLSSTIENSVVPAYYCIEAGLYGGQYYAAGGSKYSGLTAWSGMSATDRDNFTFNYDALDLIIDPLYSRNSSGAIIHPEGQKYQYDSETASSPAEVPNPPGYSLEQSVDYNATYNGTSALTYTDEGNHLHSIAENEELTRTQFEDIPNEQCHYSPIAVTKANTSVDYYVVKKAFIKGEIPYAVGQVITSDAYNNLDSDTRNYNITTLTFEAASEDRTFYYCRSNYKIGENGEGQSVTSVKGVSGSYAVGATVPVGVVITSDNYSSLVNKQKNFTIHGTAPTETSTLYVSRNSDIYDLSKEKIITVIYQYDYEESDESGLHITPISERHVLNIHIEFKSGIPLIDDITPPDIVLPGTNIRIPTPNVTPGAYEIIGGGWEIYDNENDATIHTNGKEYTPSDDNLYWYQNGYYVAYYAKTYLGKTYSNSVPLSVANYHDLHEVMSEKNKAHHMYVDHPNVIRDSKIYINDYSKLTDETDPRKNQNGLDLMKDFFDLSLLDKNSSGVSDGKVTTEGTLKDHALLNEHVKASRNLEFFLRTDLDHSKSSWTPIGTDNSTNCFEGMLHGDGHTISGLNASLFGHLCGEVYNLGVTGTFTSAGIADEGTGYMENCWVNGGTADTEVKALFNTPTNTSTRTVHLVNCYYPNTKGYTGQAGTMPKEEKAFYNGEVTYDLNEFYLFKRYSDNNTSTINGNDYSYWKDVNGVLTIQKGYYPSNVQGPYLVNDQNGEYIGCYVESRYADGDFIYQEGTIPEVDNERLYTPTDTSDPTPAGYYAIWPDDYLYFGQTLTYGYVDERTHQPLPAAINKIENRLPTATSSATTSNRVYRAPAYFRNKNMWSAYFNPNAVFAATSADKAKEAHIGMTAIDFTGGNGDLSGGYKKGLSGASTFYPPLLDDDGIFSFQAIGLTRNLLAYTNSSGKTATTVSHVLTDVTYSEGEAEGTGYVAGKAAYRTVAQADVSSVLGHWVQLDGGTYTATLDHLLVDKEDFNAPISYKFNDDYRMWYQRTPDMFVDISKGWEAISIPFEAELVTTQTKGELTHFYNGSNIGHEYWLREFAGNVRQKQGETNTYEADFNKPTAGSNTKNYTNTFLWDYYYSKDSYWDKNVDEYQKQYYSSDYLSDIYPVDNYPYSQAGTPYIIGFPGSRYYEFDLSGTWTPSNRYNNETIASPGKQTITFASKQGATIGVSDDELSSKTVNAESNYYFTPNYMGKTIDPGAFFLNGDGSGFEKATTATTAVPFRPYFTATAPARELTRSIMFSNESSKLEGEYHDRGNEHGGILDIYAKRKKIVVASTLPHAVDVRIVTTGGITLSAFTVEPGETVETRVKSSGIYIVHTSDARYTKKLSVR